MIGQSVGGYVIVDRIGSGGMGEVYVAEHRHLERRAAIKFLLPGLSRDGELVSRFFNEARALSRVDHPGIVQVLDCDVLGDRAYIVMELLEGESLAAVLTRTSAALPEPRDVAAVAGQIASALAIAHDKGIIHRDLKPDNLFFALGRQAPFGVKILDFGIAKLATDNFGPISQTRPGSLLGTPAYMAPEQCRGVAGIDHRVDVYALGCIIFEMVTGRKVFTMEEPGDLLVAHIQEPAPRLAALVPGVPARLDELVAAMLAKSPDDRPQTMGEVVSVLETMLGVPVASFGDQIPADSGLIPRPPASRPGRTVVAAREGSGRSGTRILPEDGAPATPRVAPASPSNSTFRRAASEIIPMATWRPATRVVAFVAGLAAAGIALAVMLTVRSAPRTTLVKPSSRGTPTLEPPRSPPPAPEPRGTAQPEAPADKEIAASPPPAPPPPPAPAKHTSRSRRDSLKKPTSRIGAVRAGEQSKADKKAPDHGYYGVGD